MDGMVPDRPLLGGYVDGRMTQQTNTSYCNTRTVFRDDDTRMHSVGSRKRPPK